jgi:uncharacterized membrane protein
MSAKGFDSGEADVKIIAAFPPVFVAALALVSGLAFSITPARADFRICNRMSYIVDAAIGVIDKSNVATRGWFRIEPAKCHVVAPDNLMAERYFLHARALPIYGASPTPQAGAETLCVADKDFVIAAARSCRSGQRGVPFVEVKPSKPEPATQDSSASSSASSSSAPSSSTQSSSAQSSSNIVYLGEPAEYDEEQARLAGIQRLLELAGYDASPIDGVEGPKTNAAIEKFIKDRNLASDAPQADNFFAVLLNAAQAPIGARFTWCNETPYRIMAAIGIEDDKGIATHGWYRVEAGKCVHPDLDANVRRLYSFGEAVDGDGRALKRDGEPLRWGGSRMLCTRDMTFEFSGDKLSGDKDCAARGFRETGFATIDLEANAPKTFRFKTP